MQTVIETSTLSSYVEMVPMTIPLGLSHPYGGGRASPGGGECMAVRWPMTQQVIDDIRNYSGDDVFDLPLAAAGKSDEAPLILH
jgi:hypothetical protein